MIKISFLGVEGYPQGERNTISSLVETEDYRILLDCGASIIEQLDRCNLLASDINAAFISHLHADHSSGLILLLYSCLMEHFERRASGEHEITILGNQILLDPLLDYCKAAYPAIFVEGGMVSANLKHIDSNTICKLKNNIIVEAAPMSHAVQGLSVALTIGSFKICYSADTRRTDALDKLAKGSDVLICNVFGCDEAVAESSGFMSAIGAAKLAQEIGADKLFMLHLNDSTSRKEAIHVARSFYTGSIEAPESGTCVILE